MIIKLDQVVPLPLLEADHSGSEVWGSAGPVFEQGHSYLIQAPSGKGKTSLLSFIYGLRNDYRGSISIDGQTISSFGTLEWSELRKTRLSYVFQGLELFASLSAWDNILLKNRITSFRKESEIRDMAGSLGLADHLNKKAGILSFGQQQRVAIIRALCQPFDFLLADECFSHMDRDNSRKAMAMIGEICAVQNAGFLLTSLNGDPELQLQKQVVL